MGVALSTLGVEVSYAFGITRPTSGYTILGDIKEVPDFNPSPDTIEVTPLINTQYKTYVQGLKDLGGDLAFTANFTKALLDEYNDASNGILAKYEAGLNASDGNGEKMFLCINHPHLPQSLFINVAPSPIGLNSMSVNSALEVTLHFTPLDEPIWAEDPTYAQDGSNKKII